LAAFIYATHGRFVERGVAALLALGIVGLAVKRPDRALLVLIVGLPLQGMVLSLLYAWGAPAQLVRPMTAWKEALGIGVAIAGIRGFRAAGRRLDRLDRIALAYVLFVTLYAFAPRLFAVAAPLGTDVRSLAFRSSAGFVILLLAARHARLPEDFLPRATRVALWIGAVIAAVAIYEYFFSDAWNRFVIDQIQYVRYQIDILHTPPANALDIRRYGYVGDHRFLRAGSVFLNPIPAGFALILPFAIAVERRLRSGVRNGGATTLLIVIGAGLALTQTRAAVIGALVVVFLAIRPGAGRSMSRRVQFTLLFAAAMVIAIPALATTGLNDRVASTASGQDQSSTDHVNSFWHGVDAIEAEPLGHGLGTSAGVGQRFENDQATVTENGYLQVGVETGVLSMVLFVALTVVALRRLNAAVHIVTEPSVAAIRGAATGLAIGALLLHAWNEFAVGWVMWSLIGAAIAVGDLARSPSGPAVVATGRTA
jgi:hypothetical protein